jgi:hypothetical protein
MIFSRRDFVVGAASTLASGKLIGEASAEKGRPLKARATPKMNGG